MKSKSLLAAGFLAAGLAMPDAAHAAWECNIGGYAKCYVTFVDLDVSDSSSTDTYIRAGISHPSGGTDCSTIRVRKGSSANIEAIKMAEMVLTTALETEIPVKFELVSGSDETACVVQNIVIQRPTD